MQERITNRLISELKPRDSVYEITDRDVRGFILRVQPTGKMTYYAQCRLADGRRTRLKLGSADVLKPAQARALAEEALAIVAKGADPAQLKLDAKEHTLSSF